MKYRKRPIEVEAFQMTEERRRDNSEWPGWLNEAWHKAPVAIWAVTPVNFPASDGTDQVLVNGPEEATIVGWGDFIVLEEDGSISVMHEDVFNATFEPIDFKASSVLMSAEPEPA